MQLAIALYRAGRQAEALDILRDAQRALRDELGLDASEELRSLERAILRHDPELAPPPQAEQPLVRLPAVTTSLIGRERELGDLRALVQRPDVRLLSLVGAGGTGKTRVGLALAADCHGLFADGIAFVELAPLSAPELVLPAIAHALGVTESQDESLQAAVAHWAADRELLLVLDNLEHVVAASTSLLQLLSCGTAADDRRHEPTSPPRLAASTSSPCSLWRWTLRSLSFSSARRLRTLPSRRHRTSSTTSGRSASGSTGCRWQSSWPRPGCDC